MKLYIKNMVCPRCIMVVKAELDKLGLQYHTVDLGEVELANALTDKEKNDLDLSLNAIGFKIIEDLKAITIGKIKTLIVDLVQNKSNDLTVKFLPA